MTCDRRIVAVFMAFLSLLSFGEIGSYEELIRYTALACAEPRLLLSSAYTNDLENYRNACTNACERSAADLSLSISLMFRMDNDELSMASDECFALHQSLVSNVVYSTELDQGSWIRYAAAMEYVCGLNYGNHSQDGFAVSTNMLSMMLTYPVDMGHTNFWNEMSRLLKCPDMTLGTAFRLNAALALAEEERWSEVGQYTNSLPISAIVIFQDDLQ